MTRHVSEDAMLKLTLGLLNARSDSRVRNHLKKCPECRGLMEDVDRTLEQLKDVTPEVTADPPVLPSLRRGRSIWLRAAAILAVGFALGFLASESLRPPSFNVVRQQIDPRPRALPTVGFVVCDEVDLSPRLRQRANFSAASPRRPSPLRPDSWLLIRSF